MNELERIAVASLKYAQATLDLRKKEEFPSIDDSESTPNSQELEDM